MCVNTGLQQQKHEDISWLQTISCLLTLADSGYGLCACLGRTTGIGCDDWCVHVMQVAAICSCLVWTEKGDDRKPQVWVACLLMVACRNGMHLSHWGHALTETQRRRDGVEISRRELSSICSAATCRSWGTSWPPCKASSSKQHGRWPRHASRAKCPG
jgi:hypothetical protein